MPQYPFPHHGPVYTIYDHEFEVAYYVRNRKKYRRVRHAPTQKWEDVPEHLIDNDTFWCGVAIAERVK
jgi:hypothetical protein